MSDTIDNNANTSSATVVATSTLEGSPALHATNASSKAPSNTKWGEELSDFLSAVDSYEPTIPENLTKYYIERSGLDVKDERITKFISLAADKFLADTIYEAKQISLLRQQGVKNLKRRQMMSETLEIEDLEGSLGQNRVYLRRKKNSGGEAKPQDS
jgi:transcription initiation factor TFIID subunit 10